MYSTSEFSDMGSILGFYFRVLITESEFDRIVWAKNCNYLIVFIDKQSSQYYKATQEVKKKLAFSTNHIIEHHHHA